MGSGGEISCRILGLHPEADMDRITVLACDRTDRSGSECTRPTLVAGSGGGEGGGCKWSGLVSGSEIIPHFRSD